MLTRAVLCCFSFTIADSLIIRHSSNTLQPYRYKSTSSLYNLPAINEAIHRINSTMEDLRRHITLSQGGLEEISTIVVESKLTFEPNQKPLPSMDTLRINDLSKCSQVQLVNERNEYVYALLLTLESYVPDSEVNIVQQSILRSIKSLGFQCGYKEGRNFIIDFGDISPHDFRLMLLRNYRIMLQAELESSLSVADNNELVAFYQSCCEDILEMEREVILSIPTD
jgi:hypothetical protein